MRSRVVVLCRARPLLLSLFFFFNDTAPTEIYTLSLHDALPISQHSASTRAITARQLQAHVRRMRPRSEEHTSELQSHSDLVCRLLLEKKKQFNSSTRPKLTRIRNTSLRRVACRAATTPTSTMAL